MAKQILSMSLALLFSAGASAKVPVHLLCGDRTHAIQIDLTERPNRVEIQSIGTRLFDGSVTDLHFLKGRDLTELPLEFVATFSKGAGSLNIKLDRPTNSGRTSTGMGEYHGPVLKPADYKFSSCWLDFGVDRGGRLL